MKKDGLAVEAEGVLVQRRQVSSVIVVPRQTQKRRGVLVTLGDEVGAALLARAMVTSPFTLS